MKWFINLSTSRKLLIAFGIMWLLLAVVIVTGYRGITVITQSAQKLHDVNYKVDNGLSELRSYQNYNRGQMLADCLMTTERSAQEITVQNIREIAKID